MKSGETWLLCYVDCFRYWGFFWLVFSLNRSTLASTQFHEILDTIYFELLVDNVSFTSYPDHPPGQPGSQQKFHWQMPGTGEIFLANARGPALRKDTVLVDLYAKKRPRGRGKIDS